MTGAASKKGPDRRAYAGFVAILAVAALAGFLSGRVTGSLTWGLVGGAIALFGIPLTASWLLGRFFPKPAYEPPAPDPGPEAEPEPAAAPLPSPDEELAWPEPRDFRRNEIGEAARAVYIYIGITLGLTAAFILALLIWAPGAETWKLLVTGVGISAFFLILLGFTRLMAVTVRITDKAVIWELGDTRNARAFKSIERCSLGTCVADAKTWPVLVVRTKKGDADMLALHPSIPADLVRAALERRGVRVDIEKDLLPQDTADRPLDGGETG